MTLRIGAALSQNGDPRAAAIEAAQEAAAALAGERADVAVVFASGTHLTAPEAVLEGVQEALAPGQLVGCGASGVLAAGVEVEAGTALAVWAAALGDGAVHAFHSTSVSAQRPGLDPVAVRLSGVPEVGGASAVIVLPDPYTFDTDALLFTLRDQRPQMPVLGGHVSGRTAEGGAALFVGEDVVEDGAVGLVFEGVTVMPCVSQGAAPLGPELTITGCEGRVIHELAGKPALVKLREVFDELSEHDRALLGTGLLLGLVIDSGQPEYEQGDFLVRGVVGADTDNGSIALGEGVHAGQIVRLHARNAASADLDLNEALRARREALGGSAAGALCFTCTGRGRAMFGEADHDAAALARVLDGAAAGFFAVGEIGPVHGECRQHSFSASVAVFGD